MGTMQLLLLMSTGILICTAGSLPRSSYARTSLKVSRNSPGETEEVKVRTSEGNLATLIVKRREKAVHSTASSPREKDNGPKLVEIQDHLTNWNNDDEDKNWVPIGLSSGDEWKPVEVTPRTLPRTNIGANADINRGDAERVPPEITIRSELNVKPRPGIPSLASVTQAPKRSPMTIDPDGTPVVHGSRVPDEPIDKFQTWRNARVINDQLVQSSHDSEVTTPRIADLIVDQNYQRFFDQVSRRFSKNLSEEEDAEKQNAFRNEILAAEVYSDAPVISYRPSNRKRMLHPEISVSYPNSRDYSPPDAEKIAPNLQQGTRAPVLQYAHPELGPQAAKAESSDTNGGEAPTILRNEAQQRHYTSNQQPYSYHKSQYAHQVDSRPSTEHATSGNGRHKKKYVINEKIMSDPYSYKNYYPNQHFFGVRKPEQPFWIKVSESLKSQFSDGVAKVSELTKPVFDPLMEATRKISQNLGLSSRSSSEAQDKLGTVATGSSVLIPALGLVASGAALGIGAVAVGRYLDVDVLKRSNETPDDTAHVAELDEALRAVDRLRKTEMNAMSNSNSGRMKREVPPEDLQMQRKGADSIAEIVEIDLPSDPNLVLEDNGAGANHMKSEDELQRTRRRRRNIDDEEIEDELQSLDRLRQEAGTMNHVPGDWSNTSCAKRIFCEAVIKRGSDAAAFIQKKMSSILGLIQPGAAQQVSAHFDDVANAVRRHDCSIFSCSNSRSNRNV